MIEEQNCFLNRMRSMKKLRDRAQELRDTPTPKIKKESDTPDPLLNNAYKTFEKMKKMKKLRDLAKDRNKRN